MRDRSNALLAMVGAGVEPAWPVLLAVVGASLAVMGGAARDVLVEQLVACR